MPTSEPFIKTSWTSHVVSNVVGGALGGILIVLRDASYASYIFPTQQHLLQRMLASLLCDFLEIASLTHVLFAIRSCVLVSSPRSFISLARACRA
jgi:hypothetical protein